MNKILIINKEKDYTSRDVVNIVSKKLGTKKVGHFGTLDPLAEGVLVLGIGKYTKLLNLLPHDDKEYVAVVKVGVKTDTYDITGNVIEEKTIEFLDEDVLKNALNHFKGTYMQEVPIYSAVKVNGKKLYQYARNGESINLPKKEVTIKDIELLSIVKEDTYYFTFKTTVSKGTYIRSLINDISLYLGIPLAMSKLLRTRQDIFKIEDSYTLKDIEEGNYKLLDIEDILNVNVKETGKLHKKIINGNMLEYENDNMVLYKHNNENVALYVYNKEKNKMLPFIIY